jgi:hypothetical protein
MNLEKRKNYEILRSMNSSEAADWLLETYRPKDLCTYVAKRSWKKAEQVRIAEYFLSSIPHATDRCYEALLSVMSVTTFVRVAEKYVRNADKSDYDLISYYMPRTIKKHCKTPKDHEQLVHLESILL